MTFAQIAEIRERIEVYQAARDRGERSLPEGPHEDRTALLAALEAKEAELAKLRETAQAYHLVAPALVEMTARARKAETECDLWRDDARKLAVAAFWGTDEAKSHHAECICDPCCRLEALKAHVALVKELGHG